MPTLPAYLERQLRRPYVDFALCLLLKRRRMALPLVDPAQLWPGFEEAEVTLSVLPKGDWATPMNDVVVLLKLVRALEPRRILELGSYRGFTAKGMLEHTPASTSVTAVDIDPDHGQAYRGTSFEDRVDRRVGAISPELFDPSEEGTYDLVFVDADHRRDACASDTELAFRMVSSDGMVLWHDYSNWGWFTRDCGVPEVVNEFAGRQPVGHLLGSNIAVHRREWSSDRRPFDEAVERTAADLRRGHWQSSAARRYSF